MAVYTSAWHNEGKVFQAVFTDIESTPDSENGIPVWKGKAGDKTSYIVASADDLAATEWHLQLRELNGVKYGYFHSFEAYKAATAPKEPPKPAERTAKVKVVACAPKMKGGVHETFETKAGTMYKYSIRVMEGEKSIVGIINVKSDQPPYKEGDEPELQITTNEYGTTFKKAQAPFGAGGGKTYSPPNYKALAFPQVFAAILDKADNDDKSKSFEDCVKEVARLTKIALTYMEV